MHTPLIAECCINTRRYSPERLDVFLTTLARETHNAYVQRLEPFSSRHTIYRFRKIYLCRELAAQTAEEIVTGMPATTAALAPNAWDDHSRSDIASFTSLVSWSYRVGSSTSLFALSTEGRNPAHTVVLLFLMTTRVIELWPSPIPLSCVCTCLRHDGRPQPLRPPKRQTPPPCQYAKPRQTRRFRH